MWFANILLRILVSMFISDIHLKFSIFVCLCLNPSTLLVVMQTCAATVENSMEFP